MTRLTPLAESLPSTVPFVGPEAQERQRGAAFTARLGANESLFGPSPKAIAAMEAAAPEAWMYGDPEHHDLKAALAAHHGLSPEHITIGGGIDGLLGDLVRLTVTAGDNVVTSAGAYPTFNYHVAGNGGTLHTVPYRDDHEDPMALLAQTAATGAKLTYLANPDNPMGSCHPASVIEDTVRAMPEGSLLVLDEAYLELAPPQMQPQIDPDDPQVIRMRTFSKAYGLAGLRVGYAIGAPPLIQAFNKVRNHFGVSRLSLAAAEAALGDQDWLAHVRSSVEAARDQISEIARRNGLKPLPSFTNFVTVDCGSDGAHARAILTGLLDTGIFVRMPFVSPEDRCIRVSCGPTAALDAFAKALPKVLAAQN